MARRFTSLLILVLLASLPGFGQIMIGIPGMGGGYPRGGYPGQRYPQGGQQQGRQSNSNTLIGTLRNIGDKTVVIEDDDKLVTTVSITGSTKYLTVTGTKSSIGDFQPGDRVNISANQDNNNNYKAVSMSMVREGTTDEHSLASLHTDDKDPLPRSSDSSSSSSSNSSNSNSSVGSNPNKPTLRRAASSSDDSSGSSSSSSSDNDPDRPKLRRASSSSDDVSSSSSNNSSNNSSNSTSGSSDGAPPRMRRAVSSSDDGTPKAEITPGNSASPSSPSSSSSPPSSSSPSSSDAPRLRRATPASSDSDAVVADSRPSLHADDVNGVTRTPTAPQVGPAEASSSSSSSSSGSLRGSQRLPGNGDDFIDDAREEAFSFTETLPNYVVKQYTTRYATQAVRGGRTSWQALDVVTADVIEEDGNEKYKNILVNGKPPRDNVEKTGSWSKGEFSSLQLDVLSPLTAADFHGKRSTTIVNRPAVRYDFSVEQPNSHWHIESEGQSTMPAYTGSIWIDKESKRVLRIELAAQSMPRGFPLDQVESSVDYDFVLIGEGKYLLPTHSESLSCARAGIQCSRNVIEFRNYKKFTADTSITFDDKN